MAYWLVKTEPTDYSFADLQRDKHTAWTGVTAPPALKHMRGMKSGDSVFVYHTGDAKQIVGIAEVAKSAHPDPKAGDEKLVAVDLKAGKTLKRPVTLAEIKADKRFKDFALVRISRLSVMPVSKDQWDAILEMSN